MAGTPEHAPHLPHIPVPDIKEGLSWAIHHLPVVGGATLTLAGAGLGIQMLTGTDRGSQTPPVDNAPVSDTFKPPEGGSNVVISPPQSPDTSSVSTPSGPGPDGADGPIPKPEPKAEPIECAFLADCSGAELIEWVDAQGNKYLLVGFDPKPGTSLLAYADGQLIKNKHGEGSLFRGFGLAVIDPNNPSKVFSLHGDIDMGEFRTQNISRGNQIGGVQDTGVTNFGHRIIAFAREDLLKSVIPFSILSQKPKRFEGPPPTTGPMSNSRGQATPIYANVPPPK